jgi:serine/threonine protein kinase
MWGLAVIEELRPGDRPSVGPYSLLGRLGEGGMGQVFLAMSPGRRLLAIKVIRPELAQEPGFRDRFAREINAAQRVNGMFTAPVVDSNAKARQPWMATAYVPGPSLADAVNNKGPMSSSSVLTLGAGLAEALAGIHQADIVHRDLKPSNVLIARDGPRVIDFGISLAIEASMLSAVGTVLGSPGFMSPEQARGRRDVGKPTDVFSLGAVLVFAATGIGPFGSGPRDALLYRVVNEDPDLTQVPGQLRALVERCLAKAPASRPTPAEILEILADEGGTPTGEWPPQAVVNLIDRFTSTSEFTGSAPRTPESPDLAAMQLAPGPEPEADHRSDRAEPVLNARASTRAMLGHGRGDDSSQSVENGAGRWRKWRWPTGVAALVVVVVGLVLATRLVPSGGGTSPTPSTSPTTSVTASYASDPLATGSSSITARVYFGQIKVVVSTLAHQVTFNTPAAWVDEEPGQCALTVIFAGVASPTGIVDASGLGSGWRGLEYMPSQDTQGGRLHEQIVTPAGTVSLGQSRQLSAVLVAGNQRLTSDEYSLKFQGKTGAEETWLLDGHAVSCHA